MVNIVIIGADCFIGKHLASHLSANSKIKLILFVYEKSKLSFEFPGNAVILKGDLLRPESIKNILPGNSVVINLSYLWNQSTEQNIKAIGNLLNECIKSKISKLIYCSSVGVFGRVRDDLITEETNCNPLNNYEVTKYKIENLLLNNYGNKFQLSIIRPSNVFGVEGKNLLKLENDVLKGNKILNYLKRCMYKNRPMNLVNIKTLCSAIEFLSLISRSIDKEIFILSNYDAKLDTYVDIETFFVKNLGTKSSIFPLIPIPQFFIKILLILYKKSNINPVARYSNKKIKDFGFQELYSLEDELLAYVKWAQDKKESCLLDE